MTDPTTPQQHTCPRRMSDFGPWPRTEGSDTWEPDRGFVGQGLVGLSCSFCGSLHPDRFMELVKAGWIVGPTDKNYKAYLTQPPTEAEVAARKQQWMTGDSIARAIRDVGARDGKTPEQIEADVEREWTERWAPHVYGKGHAKFYYQHLSSEQRDEFIDLYNSGRMRLDHPGYLYVTPFFCTRANPSQEAVTD